MLWRESEHVEQLSYGRHELMSSDHKPVSAVFLTRVKVVVADRRNEVHNEILRELDKMDNSRRPDAALNSSHFTFEQVRWVGLVGLVGLVGWVGWFVGEFVCECVVVPPIRGIWVVAIGPRHTHVTLRTHARTHPPTPYARALHGR